MRVTFLAAALALTPGASAWAQQPPAAQAPIPPAQTVNPPTGTAANANATASGLRVGQAIIDSTGLTVGKLSELKADPTGKPLATLQIGTETLTVEADSLTVRGAVASINATQAELKAMAQKPNS